MASLKAILPVHLTRRLPWHPIWPPAVCPGIPSEPLPALWHSQEWDPVDLISSGAASFLSPSRPILLSIHHSDQSLIHPFKTQEPISPYRITFNLQTILSTLHFCFIRISWENIHASSELFLSPYFQLHSSTIRFITDQALHSYVT